MINEMVQFAWLHEQPQPDLIIPVPLHPRRLRQRGFNQALELAKPLGVMLDRPVEALLLERVEDTPSQTGLNEAMRRRNVKQAFDTTRACPNVHVALIDDVVTSGSTVNEAAKTLLENGAKTVCIWAVSKTASSWEQDIPSDIQLK